MPTNLPASGQITLGAAVAPPELHLWVADTGVGHPRRTAGADLRAIHQRGSQCPAARRDRPGPQHHPAAGRAAPGPHNGGEPPGAGSTFHVYLPLPPPVDLPAPVAEGEQGTVLLIANSDLPPAELLQLADRRGLTCAACSPTTTWPSCWGPRDPALLAWDLTSARCSGLAHRCSRFAPIRSSPSFLDPLRSRSRAARPSTANSAATGLLLKPLSENMPCLRRLTICRVRDPAGQHPHRRRRRRRYEPCTGGSSPNVSPTTTSARWATGAPRWTCIATRPPA